MIIYNQSDEDLMGWVCLGQTGPFEELVRRYENKFLAVAFRKTRNHASAEDIVQEVFTDIYQDPQRFDSKKARFSTWAYAILENKIKMFLRDNWIDSQMVSLASVDEDRDDLLASAQANWFEDCSTSRFQKLKELILKYLTIEEQALYYLKEEKGLSYEQIAQQEPFKSQGFSPDTLMKRRQRYIKRLIDGLEMEKYTFKCLPREVREIKNGKNRKV
jgi:RNA polymerase sigma factor (sigma-70 family)